MCLRINFELKLILVISRKFSLSVCYYLLDETVVSFCLANTKLFYTVFVSASHVIKEVIWQVACPPVY